MDLPILTPPAPATPRSPRPVSLSDLARRFHEPAFDFLREFYTVSRMDAVPLQLNEATWKLCFSAFQAPRELVERQSVIAIHDLIAMRLALFNELRALRGGAPVSAATSGGKECSWCGGLDIVADEFGVIESSGARFTAFANYARQTPGNGMAIGNAAAHSVPELSKDDFTSLFTVQEPYIQAVRRLRPDLAYWALILNGGANSASSVPHAHTQSVGLPRRHFSFIELLLALSPPDYWNRMREIHQKLGLAIGAGIAHGWVNLAPVKERDITIVSPDVHSGASFLYDVLQVLMRHGTNSFSIAAALSPSYVGAEDLRFAGWPPVVWRFLDRGDARLQRADMGSIEALLGSSVISTDPWRVAEWLGEKGDKKDDQSACC